MSARARHVGLLLWLLAPGACTVSTDFRAPDLSHSTLTVSSVRVLADGASTAAITVSVVLDNGKPLPQASVQLAAPGAIVTQVSTVPDSNGMVTGSITSTQNGTVTVSAIVSTQEFTLTLAQTALVQFIAPVLVVPTAAALQLSVPASSTQAGVPLTFVITAVDTAGQRATGYAATLVAASSDANAIIPNAIVFSASNAGRLTVSNVIFLRTAGSQTVTFTDALNPALSVTSPNIAVGAADAAQMTLTGPGQIDAGVFGTFALTVQDSFGNRATGYMGNITFASSSIQATLPATYTFQAADAGTYTFNGALGVAGPQTVTVTDASLPTLASTLALTVKEGALAALNLQGLPGQTTAGATSDMYLTAQDANGNVVSTYAGTVTFSSSDPTATLPASTTLPGGNKVFSPGVVLRTSGAQTVSVTDGQLQTQSAVDVEAAAFVTASLTASPNTQVANGQAFVSVLALAQDIYGNAVPNQNVILRVSEPTDALTHAVGTTDNQGQFAANLTAWVPGPRRIDAYMGPQHLTAAVQFTTTPCGNLSFGAAIDYAAIAGPSSVAWGDLNGDGLADLAVSNYRGQGLQVFFNQGDGTLGAYTGYNLNAGPVKVVIADLNNDALQDMIVVDKDDYLISVLMNTGSGVFAPQVLYVVCTNPDAIAVADLDNDGDLDAVVTCLGGAAPNDDRIGILYNQGQGVFYRIDYRKSGSQPSQVAPGDMNQDGLMDLVVLSQGDNNVNVMINQGNTVFATPVPYAVGSSPFAVAVADVNGDTALDVISVNHGDNTVSILLNQTDGTLASQVTYAAPNQPTAVVPADVNGDGCIDLVTIGFSGNLDVYLNQNFTGFAAAVEFAAGNFTAALAVADINADGKADVAITALGSNASGVMLNTCQ